MNLGGSAAAAPAAEAAAAKDDEDVLGLSALGRSKRPQYKFVGELHRQSLHVPAPPSRAARNQPRSPVPPNLTLTNAAHDAPLPRDIALFGRVLARRPQASHLRRGFLPGRPQWAALLCCGRLEFGASHTPYTAMHCSARPAPPRFHALLTGAPLQCTLFECLEDGSTDVLQVFVDEDVEEIFFALAWSLDEASGQPLLAIGGLRGVIKIISASTQELIACLLGHGNSVNELRFHPVDPALLLSVSKDESVRLWNTISGVCIAVFAGHQGHRDEVLSGDIHPLGNCMASCGMDNSIKVWSLESETLQLAIAESYEHLSHKDVSTRRAFGTRFIQFPIFSTTKVHSDYVDCVRWVGNLLLSKSTGNEILLWKPDSTRRKDAATILRSYVFTDANIWFVRFALDADCTLLAVGNKSGKLYVWDVDSPGCSCKLQHPQSKVTVRQTALSPDGSILIGVCDDSTIWRWDRR